MCGTKEILWKNVREKGNPIEICAGQRKSYRKMCGTTGIREKNVRYNWNPIEKCAGQRKSYRKMCGTKEILLKSWKKPHNLSPILAPAPGTPGNPGKNLTICGPSPGPPEILEKTSQSADRHRDRRKSWKKTSQYYGFAWLLVVPTSCAEAPCGGKNLHRYSRERAFRSFSKLCLKWQYQRASALQR